MRAQVAHRVDHLVVGLAEPDDDPALGEDWIVGELLCALKQPERLVVGRLCAAHPAMQPPHRLDVVVEDLRLRGEHRAKRLFLDAKEIRRQHLDARLRKLSLERADRRRIVARTAIGHVIAVDGRDYDMLQVHLRCDLREP